MTDIRKLLSMLSIAILLQSPFCVAQYVDSEKNNKLKNKYSQSSSSIHRIYELVVQNNTIDEYESFVNQYPDSYQVQDAIERIYHIVIQSNSIIKHYKFIDKYPPSHLNDELYESVDNLVDDVVTRLCGLIEQKRSIKPDENILDILDMYQKSIITCPQLNVVAEAYNLTIQTNTIDGYEKFINKFSLSYQAKSAIEKIYDFITQINTIEEYYSFAKKYPVSPQAKNAIGKIYDFTVQINTIDGYKKFINEFPQSLQVKNAIEKIYDLIAQKNTILDYENLLTSFYFHYASSHQKNKVVGDIFNIVDKKENIAGYLWFMDKYPSSDLVVNALTRMHEIAYRFAETEGSIESYNDFIIAYPYSKQIRQAIDNAYVLEEKEYSGWFSSDAKNSRALLVRSKQIERKVQNVLDNNLRYGYLLIINRMNELLQNKFPAEDATLRYLESEEFNDFYKNYRLAIKDINNVRNIIANNTNELSSVVRAQSNMINNHFGNIGNALQDQSSMIGSNFRSTSQSQKMSEVHADQHRYWERYLKE